MRENKGISLVEVLVTVAILSVVIVTAGAFMTTSSRSFARESADSDVQSEAELAVNQIEDLIIDVNGGVAMTDDDDKMEMLLYHAEDVGSGVTAYKKRTVTWDKTSGNIECSEWNMAYDSSVDDYVEDGAAVYDSQLLADNVTNFIVDLGDTVIKKGAAKDGGDLTIIRSVSIRVDCEDANGRAAYATSPIITLRNRMMLANNAKEIFDLTPVADTTFQLYISENTIDTAVPIIDRVTTVEKTSVYHIFAMVNLGACVNDLVDWEIEEADSISMIDTDGVLSVAEYEPNAYLTITARYKSNPNKKATGVVKVKGDSRTLGVSIYTKSLIPFNPKYGSTVTTDGYTEEEKARFVYKWTVSEPERVEPFVDSMKDLELAIKKEEGNYGKYFTITLTVTSPDTGQSASASIVYRIDNNYVVDGDSYFMRGYGSGTGGYGNTYFEFITPFWSDSITLDCYFCDEYGNRIHAYDYLLQYVELELTSSVGNLYWITFNQNLPANRGYYLKVLLTYHNNHDVRNEFGDLYEDVTYERIHEIAAVQINGRITHVQNATLYSGFEFYYDLIGYYANTWSEKEPYAYSVEEIVYDAPEGVIVTCDVVQTETRGDEEVYARATFECNQEKWMVQDQVKLKSAKIKIYLKDNPEVYGYQTIIFE